MLTAEGNIHDTEEPLLEGKRPEHDLRYLLDRTNPVEYQSHHDELVFFSSRDHPHHNYLQPLLANRLAQDDIPVYFLFYHNLISRTFPDLTIENIQVSNCLRVQKAPYLFRSGQIGYPRFDWNVDLENEIIQVNGLEDINFFPVFLATLRKEYQVYDIDFSNPEVAMSVQQGLFTADEILRHCQLLSRFSLVNDVSIKLIAWETSYLPHGLLHLYCKSDSNIADMQYIKVGTAYAQYFGSVFDFPYYISSQNLTKRDTHQQMAGYSEEFQEYYDRVKDSSERLKTVEEEVKSDLENDILGPPSEAVNISAEESQKLKDRINRTKDEGNNVFALFTHKFYDVGLFDDGFIFDDMCDWIDRTLEIFRERDDLLILKPHPGEVDKVTPEEEPEVKLRDYVEGEISTENIILLEPRSMSSIALYQEMDCSLIWRSSVGIENMILGIPCIVAGKPYYTDYLSLQQPKDFTRYKQLIDDPASIKITPQDQTRAAVYLHFFKHFRHFFLPHIKNLDYKALDPRKLRWNEERIDMLLEGDCQNIDAIIDEFDLDGFSGGYTVQDELRKQFPEKEPAT